MTFLLDVNALIAAIWVTHAHHSKTDAWLQDKRVALCPISELGFLRISSNPRALAASMSDALKLLEDFYSDAKPQFVPADASAKGLAASASDQVTDLYLADLAASHGMKLATLDAGISHTALDLIS